VDAWEAIEVDTMRRGGTANEGERVEGRGAEKGEPAKKEVRKRGDNEAQSQGSKEASGERSQDAKRNQKLRNHATDERRKMAQEVILVEDRLQYTTRVSRFSRFLGLRENHSAESAQSSRRVRNIFSRCRMVCYVADTV
jgi:hypothetical protein